MELKDLITAANSFFEESPLNRVEEVGIENIYERPLLGVAAADDPLFEQFKSPSIAGDNHLLPRDWLPGAKTVLSYFLPFSEKIRRANRKPGFPAEEWLYGRIEGQKFSDALSRHLAAVIDEKAGEKAVIPAQDPRFEISENMVASWSERHAAYAAGLGTFSLSRSMITARGCAGRFGSVVTSLDLVPSERPYSDPFAYCTFCGECLKRCPPKAIEPVGNDKKAGMDQATCKKYLDTKVRPRFKPRYGCGKCQTAVQCEHEIPTG